MTGSLPIKWAEPFDFRSLQQLQLMGSNLTGTLPDEWGSATAFQQLGELKIFGCNVTGAVFSF